MAASALSPVILSLWNSISTLRALLAAQSWFNLESVSFLPRLKN
jgi:hypothetical protein